MKDVKDLSQREYKTQKRFDVAMKSTEILQAFFKVGFTSFDALYAIVKFYYPDLVREELWDFWHLRRFNQDMLDILNDSFEKLKSE